MASIMGADYTAFQSDFNKLAMSEYANEAAWEAEWGQFISKYEAMKGPLPYMRKLYELRKKWAKAYHGKHLSCQVMASSRGEGYNALTKRFLSKKTTLSMVMTLLAEDTEVEKRFRTDFKDARDAGNNVIVSTSGRHLLWYTRYANIVPSEIFDIITQQFDASSGAYDMSLELESVPKRVVLQSSNSILRRLVVEVISSTNTITSCDCYFHTSMGMPCRHMFHALMRNNLPSSKWAIADSCLHGRWKRTVEQEKVTFQLQVSNWLDEGAPNTSSSSHQVRAPNTDLLHRGWYGTLLSKAKNIVNYVVERKNIADYEIAAAELDKVMNTLHVLLENPVTSSTASVSGATAVARIPPSASSTSTVTYLPPVARAPSASSTSTKIYLPPVARAPSASSATTTGLITRARSANNAALVLSVEPGRGPAPSMSASSDITSEATVPLLDPAMRSLQGRKRKEQPTGHRHAKKMYH